MKNIKRMKQFLKIKMTMPEMKHTLGWIKGKLDIAEVRICECKHKTKEPSKMKHTEKFKNLRNKQKNNEL